MTFSLERVLREATPEARLLHRTYLNSPGIDVMENAQLTRNFVSGEGYRLTDQTGKTYLDLYCGFGVFAFGRNHPVAKAALEQALALNLPTLIQHDAPPLAAALARELVSLTPGMQKVYFCCTGSETVDAAIKLSRRATGRTKLLYYEDSFHGMLNGSLSVCGSPSFRKGFEPLLPDCAPIPPGDLGALEKALSGGDVAALLAEPIQGMTIRESPSSYWKEADRLCRKAGTLLVMDEVLAGLGRTGTFFAHQKTGVQPDMVLASKALSAGLVPVGAVLCKAEVFDRVYTKESPFSHGSTFSKNALAMAAGLAALHIIREEGLVARAAKTGEIFLGKLNAMKGTHPKLEEVRGRGLMIGLRLSVPANEIAVALDHLGFLTTPGKDVLRLFPALNVEERDLDLFVEALSKVLSGPKK